TGNLIGGNNIYPGYSYHTATGSASVDSHNLGMFNVTINGTTHLVDGSAIYAADCGWTPPLVDVCPNLNEMQTALPDGLVFNNAEPAQCVPVVSCDELDELPMDDGRDGGVDGDGFTDGCDPDGVECSELDQNDLDVNGN